MTPRFLAWHIRAIFMERGKTTAGIGYKITLVPFWSYPLDNQVEMFGRQFGI